MSMQLNTKHLTRKQEHVAAMDRLKYSSCMDIVSVNTLAIFKTNFDNHFFFIDVKISDYTIVTDANIL